MELGLGGGLSQAVAPLGSIYLRLLAGKRPRLSPDTMRLIYLLRQSLTFGRPPSFSNAFIDCQMPEPEPQSAPDKGDEVEMTCA